MERWLLLLASIVAACAVGVRPALADSCAIRLGQLLSPASIHHDDTGMEGGNCADYFRRHAKIQLGVERRLSNGISWRLQTDTISGVSLPRFTWMPRAQGLRVANLALDALHGDLLFAVASANDEIRRINRSRRLLGSLPLPLGHPLDQVITEVTYASSMLISMIDIGYWEAEGNSPLTRMSGMTIDLEEGRLYEKAPCPNEGQTVVGENGKRVEGFFRFGDLLTVCDHAAYRKFMNLLRASAENAAGRVTESEQSAVAECLQHYRRPVPKIDEGDREEVLALYLTFEGLAVQSAFDDFSNAKNGNCTTQRSAINPVVIPYHDLEPLMLPGPWRNELLRLR